MFESKRSKQGLRPTHPDAYATSAVAVLPGHPLPPSLVTALPGVVVEDVQEPVVVPAPPVPAQVAVPHVAPHVAGPVVPVAPVSPPAGWYVDPSGRPGQRYWDGAAWTDHTA